MQMMTLVTAHFGRPLRGVEHAVFGPTDRFAGVFEAIGEAGPGAGESGFPERGAVHRAGGGGRRTISGESASVGRAEVGRGAGNASSRT
jgi:hypothetical protein